MTDRDAKETHLRYGRDLEILAAIALPAFRTTGRAIVASLAAKPAETPPS
jgi:hypothetical protein